MSYISNGLLVLNTGFHRDDRRHNVVFIERLYRIIDDIHKYLYELVFISGDFWQR